MPMSPSIAGNQRMPKEVLDFINLILQNYNPIENLPLFSDDQLRRLIMPVLLIIGENDVIIEALETTQRLARLVPSAEIHLLPEVGHAIANSLAFVMPFLQKEDTP
jgi:pimeloyl-ACP methyl ester carboxylesterase